MKRIALLIALIIAVVAANAQDGKRCAGITAKKVQCRNVVTVGSHCHHHNPSGLKCGALTSKKTPCKMKVSKAGERCKFHKD
jgi:hypothetical protein